MQIGVFTSFTNAEAMREKLKASGIEARTETRVQVGPFSERVAAEGTLAKIRALGIQAVLVPVR